MQSLSLQRKWQIYSVKIIISLALLSLLFAYLSFIYLASSPDWDTDYKYLYFSAQQVWHQANIYYPLRFFSPSLNGVTEIVNLNPPMLAIIMALPGLMYYTASFWLWSLLNLAMEIGGVLLIVDRFFQPQREKFWIFLASILLLLSFFPTFINLYAQTAGLIFLLTVLGWLSFREKKLGLAGFFWGLAFSIKLFIGLFVWMLVWRKEWRCLRAMLLTTSVCLAITIFFFGPNIYAEYSAVFAKVNWYSASWNASLLGFFARIFGYLHETNRALIHLPQLAQIAYSTTALFLLGMFAFFQEKYFKDNYLPLRAAACPRHPVDNSGHREQVAVRRRKDMGRVVTFSCELLSRDLMVAYTLVAMLLISPLAWIYYFLLLLIPSAVIFYWNRYVFQQEWINLFLAAALFLSSVPHLLLKPHKITNGYDIFLWSGCYFYALCILVTILLKLKQLFNRGVLSRSRNMTSPLLAILFTAAFLPSFFGILMIICLLWSANSLWQ